MVWTMSYSASPPSVSATIGMQSTPAALQAGRLDTHASSVDLLLESFHHVISCLLFQKRCWHNLQGVVEIVNLLLD